MSIKIVQKLTPYNFTKAGDLSRIKWIVIHYYGTLASANNISSFFASAYRGASAHYAVDDTPTVFQIVKDEDISWHCGTTGTYYHPTCRNSNSIGIEVMPRKINQSVIQAANTDWYFDQATIDNAIELTKLLMKKYNVPVNRVIRHYDVTHKMCPRPFVGADINTYYKTSGDYQWSRFKKQLVEEEEEMNLDQFEELYNEMLARKKGDHPSPVFVQSCEKAKAAKIFGGDGKGNFNWQDPISREAVAGILDRAKLLDK